MLFFSRILCYNCLVFKGKEIKMKKLLLGSLMALSLALNAEICVKNGDAVAFMGDSITQQGNGTPAGYVNLVMKGLELCGVNAKKIPAGISGHKSVQMNARLKKDVLDKNPKWMTFSCGVNDVWHGKHGVSLDKYKVLVSEIFDKCAAQGIEVIVLTATMIGEDAENSNNKLLAPYNEWLRAEAKKRKLRLADLNADMQAQLAEIKKKDKTPGNKLTVDGVHMAFDGNCMMAWGVLKAMGVDESKKAELFAAFRKQLGAYK
jgi:lysophospholipase L1-like esterase